MNTLQDVDHGFRLFFFKTLNSFYIIKVEFSHMTMQIAETKLMDTQYQCTNIKESQGTERNKTVYDSPYYNKIDGQTIQHHRINIKKERGTKRRL